MNELSLFLFNKYHGRVRLCVASRIILRTETEEHRGKNRRSSSGLSISLKTLPCNSPDDHDDAIKDVVGVLDVAEGPVDQHLQQHLQREQAGEHDVTDLQRIGQLIRLETQRQREESG